MVASRKQKEGEDLYILGMKTLEYITEAYLLEEKFGEGAQEYNKSKYQTLKYQWMV